MRIFAFLFLILGICTCVFGANLPPQWVARYNGPGNSEDTASALAIDTSGNTYVTGYSYDSNGYSDYATIKYDSNGNQLWMARYSSYPGDYSDYAIALATDGSGNVYVTGTSYDSNGWGAFATIKYDTNGNQIWAALYGTETGSIESRALAVDNSGNVYVTGYSDSNGSDDYATVKYSPDGNQLWAARYNGPGNSGDYASALALDSSGNVYVTGSSPDSNIVSDYATIKYDPNGNQIWETRYNGPWNSDAGASDLIVDNSGNVYVTGNSDSNNTDTDWSDYATVKYSPDGNQLWVARYNGPGNDSDIADSLKLDDYGNVYVTGSSNNSSGYDTDYATVKYSPDGNQLWAARYNNPVQSNDNATDIAVDSSGNVYVTGGSDSDGVNLDYATVKYDPNGNQLWIARYNGPGNDSDVANALAVDSSGNVYVTGYSYSSDSGLDYITIKYVEYAHYRCMEPVVGDFNNDCKVDFEDLAIMSSHWLECGYDQSEDCL